MCRDTGVGLPPYSPPARTTDTPVGQQTHRAETDTVAKIFDSSADQPIVGVVQQIAERRGLPMAQIALAWVLRNPVGPPQSSGRPRRCTLPTRSHPLTSFSATTRWRRSKPPTCVNRPIGSSWSHPGPNAPAQGMEGSHGSLTRVGRNLWRCARPPRGNTRPSSWSPLLSSWSGLPLELLRETCSSRPSCRVAGAGRVRVIRVQRRR